jgi:G:T-mismatch repair DNA endonuclease (very short patch repair protein)
VKVKGKPFQAKEAWKEDEEKLSLMKEFGFDVFVVWESDYNKNKAKIKEMFIKIILDKFERIKDARRE